MQKMRPQKQHVVEPRFELRHLGSSVHAPLPLPTAHCLPDGLTPVRAASKGLVTTLDTMAFLQQKPKGAYFKIRAFNTTLHLELRVKIPYGYF